MNEEVFHRPLHENLSVKKWLGTGNNQFHQVYISANGVNSCFNTILYVKKVCKQPYGEFQSGRAQNAAKCFLSVRMC